MSWRERFDGMRERFDGWLNPVAVKELRQAVRGRFIVTIISLSLLAQIVTVAGFMVTDLVGDRMTSGSGAIAFTILFMLLNAGTLLFVPLYGGVRMAAERSDTNIDLLFITTIRPRTIVAGKVLTMAALTALIFFTSLPFLIFAYVLRGIDIMTILVLLAFSFLIVCSYAIAALFIGSIPSTKPFKLMLGFGFFAAMVSTFFTLAGIVGSIAQVSVTATYLHTSIWEFVTGPVGVLIVVDFVLLVLTAAVIAPPTANRALPIRVTLLALWALSLVTVTRHATANRNALELVIWASVQIGIASLVLFSATGERERWGARVARTIPRNPFGRALAFLFYSGAAGGTLWALLLLLLTPVVYEIVRAQLPPPWHGRHASHLLRLLEASLCLYGYAMTALLLRRKVLKRIPARATWGIALALFVLGAIVPPLIFFASFSNTGQLKQTFLYATLFNPFPQFEARTNPLRIIVLGSWALLMFSANASWIAAQWRGFRRPNGESAAVDEESGGTLALTEVSRP